MTRRELLALCSAWVSSVGGSLVARGRSDRAKTAVVPALHDFGRVVQAATRKGIGVVDHFVWTAPDLDAGIAWIESRTGVRPAIGGSHPGRETRNALFSLGQGQYVEVLAPDPAQQPFTGRGAELARLPEPRLVAWAARTTDIEALARRLLAIPYRIDGPFSRSRPRPDGVTVRFTTLGVSAPGGELIPFFIQWDPDSRHPSEDSPGGCSLLSFHIESPEPDPVRETLETLGLEIPVQRAPTSRLRLRLASPKGPVEIA